MPYSAGSFSLYATGNPVVTGSTISSSWANSTLSDIASGLSTCVLKDGTQTITANIPMGGFKLTGLAAGSATGNSLRYDDVYVAALANIPMAGFKLTGLAAGSAAGDSVRYEQSPAGLFTAAGQIVYATATGTPAVLNIGATGAPLLANASGFPSWTSTVTANAVLAGPTSGAAATPTFRALTFADVTLFTVVSNSLAADVSCSVTSAYFTGPSTAQGTAGTWLAVGTITMFDATNNGDMNAKLWDGTTVIDSTSSRLDTANSSRSISLSGVITNPAGNIRISANAPGATTPVISANKTGNAKDSTLTVVRIG